MRPDGTLIAGTTPGGRVFSGRPEEAATSQAVRDAARRARLGAGARRQERHRLRRHRRAGEDVRHRRRRHARARIWDSGDKHVVSLLVDDDKHLYAGTSEEAILYKVGLDGRAEALADFDAEEVRALARFGGVAVRGGQRLRAVGGRRSTPGAAAAPRGTKITTATSGSPASAGIAAAPGPAQGQGRALPARRRRAHGADVLDPRRLLHDAGVRRRGAAPTSAPAARGASSASPPTAPPRWRSTSPSGRRWRCCAPATASWSARGDVGGVYRAAPAAPQQATYLSRVLDGEYRARWGLFRWHGTHDARHREPLRATPPSPTRPGPASRRWSGRARPATGAWARSPARPPATSSTARPSAPPTARLAAVTLAYLPQNQRARITELGRADSGGAPARVGALGALAASAPAAAAARAHQTVHQAALEGGEPRRRRARLPARLPPGERRGLAPAGRARSADQDRIRLEHRGAARRDLRRQASPPATSAPSRASARSTRRSRRRRSWSTTASPRSSGWRRSIRSSRAARATTRARSSAMEYAIDGGEWQMLSAADGICDDLVEAFTIKLPALAPGPHAVDGPRLGQRRQRRRRRHHDQGAGQMTGGGDDTAGPAARARGRPDRGRPAPELLRDPLLPGDARGRDRRSGLGGRPPAARGRAART